MPRRPVGFDLDMTLIDSRPQVLESFVRLSEETGVAIDVGEVESRLGLKLEDELAWWFEDSRVEGAARVFRRHYVELASATTALPGAREALAVVREAGASSAIITAKHQSSVALCLSAADLVADEVVCFVHGPQKADVLRRIGAALYVGDTPADMTAAASAGVFGVGVATGSFTEHELRSAGASVTLTTLHAFGSCYDAWLDRTEGRSVRGHGRG